MIDRCRLPRGVERTVIGFMGCYAAINGLKLARHIVRSEPDAQVLVVNIELCTLHLQETTDIEKLLSFMLFADGCAASLVTAEPEGLAIDSFRAVVVPQTSDLITWHIRNSGFEMILSGQVPAAIQDGLRDAGGDILRGVKPDSMICGLCIPADVPCSTPSSAHSISTPTRCRFRARSCEGMATCRRRR